MDLISVLIGEDRGVCRLRAQAWLWRAVDRRGLCQAHGRFSLRSPRPSALPTVRILFLRPAPRAPEENQKFIRGPTTAQNIGTCATRPGGFGCALGVRGSTVSKALSKGVSKDKYLMVLAD